MPSWLPIMVLCCVAAFIVGWILGYVVEEWKNK